MIEPITGLDIKKYKFDDAFLRTCLPKDFHFHREPKYHQLLSLVFALQFSSFGNYSVMGLGKTKVAIDFLRAKKIKNDILVVSIGATLANWKAAFDVDAKGEYRIAVLEGSKEDKQRVISANAHDVYTINYESLYIKDENNNTVLLPSLRREWKALVFDESRAVMNPNAIRTKAAMALSRNTKYRIVMAGLPIAKTLDEIFSQQYCIDLGDMFGKHFDNFLLRYFYKTRKRVGWNRYVPYYEEKEHAAEEIHRKMYYQSIRFRKEECADLPKKITITRYVEMFGDQKRFYEDLFDNKKNIVPSKVGYLEVKALLQKFMQITGGWVILNPDEAKEKDKKEKKQVIPPLAFKQNAKLRELDYLLENDLAHEKVVISACYRAEQVGIYNYLKKKKIPTGIIVSGMKPTDIYEVSHAFNTSSKYRVVVMSPRVGGRGIDLIGAAYMILYSQDFDFEIYLQLLDRVHRYGQNRDVTYIQLRAFNTQDDNVYEVLAENQKLVQAVVEGRLAKRDIEKYYRKDYIDYLRNEKGKTLGEFIRKKR